MPAALQRLTAMLDHDAISVDNVRLVTTALATTAAATRAALPQDQLAGTGVGARLQDCVQALGAARDATLDYRSAQPSLSALRLQARQVQRGAELLGRWPLEVPPALSQAVVRQLPAAVLALRDSCSRAVIARDVFVSDRRADLRPRELQGDIKYAAWFPIRRTTQSDALTRGLSDAYLHAHLARRRLDIQRPPPGPSSPDTGQQQASASQAVPMSPRHAAAVRP